MRGIRSWFLAVLGPQRDALAVGLHHQHVAGWQAGVGVAGPLVISAQERRRRNWGRERG
jgi:hypothetical protein